MAKISNKVFTPAQLRSIRQAVTGVEGGEIKLLSNQGNNIREAFDKGMQDVLIIGPDDNIFKSDFDLSDSLKADGVAVTQDFDDLGVAAKVTPKQAKELEKSGFRVFDNSPRPMWSIPSLSRTVNSEPGDYSMPEVKPVEWLKADQVQAEGRTGKGQTVAVLDSGFQHPEFELAGWKDVVDGSPVPVDRVGHGTHVAHDVLQAAPDADIIAVKVMGDDGSGRPSDIIAGIDYVMELNRDGADIDIINMSLGGGPDGIPDWMHPINKAVKKAKRSGITVVAAAGNSGPEPGTIGAPAESSHAITVGATFDPNTVSDFSSRGPTEYGLIKPDVLAPGEFISAWSVPGSEMEKNAQVVEMLRNMPAPQLKELLINNPELAQGLGVPPEVLEKPADEVAEHVKPGLPPMYIPEPGLVAAPGTSFAAPLVAGVLATLEQEQDIDPLDSMDLLRETAKSVGDQPENVQGKGFVDAKEALDTLRAG